MTAQGPPQQVGPSGDVPRQLPGAMRHFVGREAELKRLDELAISGDEAGPAAIITIVGTAGIGKTAVAVRWAHRAADRFPDGQLYVNLHGFDPSVDPTPVGEALRCFLDALEVSPEQIPSGLDGQAALYRSLVADRRMLVVLDNAADAAQVRPLLPGGPRCLVLVTSRSQLTGLVAQHGAHSLVLEPLTDSEAHRLLCRYVGTQAMTVDPEAEAELIRLCAGLPLALVVVAARVAVRRAPSLAVLAADLARDSGRLDALDAGHSATNVRAVFSSSFCALSDDAQRMFWLLAVHPGRDISTPAAASLAAVPVRRAQTQLAELVDLHLVTQHEPGRFTFHDLFRGYAGELLHEHDADPAGRMAMRRLLDYYLHTAHAAALALDPHREPIVLPLQVPGVTCEHFADREQAMAWFVVEYRAVRAVVVRAADSGFDSHAWQLTWALENFIDLRGHWRDQDALDINGIALLAAQRDGSASGQAHAHVGLAVGHARQGRPDAAEGHLRSALALLDEVGDDTAKAYTFLILSWVLGLQDDHRVALRHSRTALELFEATGKPAMQAQALNGIGWCEAQLGNYQHALSACQDALELLRMLGDRKGEAATWDSLAYVHRGLESYEQAIACYEQATLLLHDLGDRYHEAETLRCLADTQEAAGAHQAARVTWQHALAILDELHHPNADQVRTKLGQMQGGPENS
jgi:tetratricopeptide (TPR) repeat protein